MSEAQHRQFGIALLEAYADLLIDRELNESFDYYGLLGLSKWPDTATSDACFDFQWARWIARNPQPGDEFTLRDLLARTIIEVQP